MDKKTPLYEEHVRAGARIVPFAGFAMPIQYSGIIEEHRAVRSAAGMFDLSHMGEFRVTGTDALQAVSRLLTNDVLNLAVGQVRYTPMCYENGGIVDDLLVYRYTDHLMLVVNASNIEKDYAWVVDHLTGDARVENISDEVALIAVQGPRAQGIVQGLTSIDLAGIAYYHFTVGEVASKQATVSRTGYTGEDGFELYLAPEDAPHVWQAIEHAGSDAGLRPVGLGARDTLRLEAGLMLYGNDIDSSTTPLEAGLGWTVKFDHDFIGREALERQKAEGVPRRIVAIEMQDRAIPRQHYPVNSAGVQVGEITSGTFSPTMQHGIGLAYVDPASGKTGTEVGVTIRNDDHPARVVRKPVYKREEV